MTSAVTCRIADSRALTAAAALLGERYTGRGYEALSIPTGPGHTTLVAEEDGRVIATVTLVIDGDAARLIRLASSAGSAEVLAGLFDLALQHGTETSQARELRIEVSPRHASFYRRRFGFQPVGAETWSAEVGAPAQLMAAPVSSLGRAPPP